MKRVTNIIHPGVTTKPLSNGFYPFFDSAYDTTLVLNHSIRLLIYEESKI